MKICRIPQRAARGFTLIELMLVLMVVGILSTFAIPYFQRSIARAQRSEMHNILEKMRVHFIHQHRMNGKFPVPTGEVQQNPAGAAGTPREWDPTLNGWQQYPWPPQGALRMRYSYTVSADGQTLALRAVGLFPGLGAYSRTETYEGEVQTGTVEVPDGF